MSLAPRSLHSGNFVDTFSGTWSNHHKFGRSNFRMKLKTRLFPSRKILLNAILVAAFAFATHAEVPYANANPFERSIFGDDWGVLSNDIFFGGARGMFGLSPANRTLVFSPTASFDRAGDRQEINGYVGTLRDVFDVGLFDNISHFVGPSSGKTSTTSIADIGSIYYYTGVLNSDWSDDATWNPGAGYPNAIGDVATNELSVSTNVFQDVSGGVTVGTINHNPTSPANAGPGVTWQITTTNPITMDEDGAGPGSAHISNSQILEINSLTIDGPGGLILADNLIITNANPNGGFINIATGISGPVGNSVTVTGLGLVRFTTATTFQGQTLITGGRLEAGAEDALGATSSITVSSGGTLLFSNVTTDRIRDAAPINLNGGRLETGGLSEGTPAAPGMGALTLTLTNTIDLGTGNSIISFADSSGQTWTGATLRIVNWTGTVGLGDGTDQVYFGTTSGGLNQGQLDQISFYSDAAGLNFLGTGMILPDGEVVPVPEPATWAGAALALGAILWRRRRHLRTPVS